MSRNILKDVCEKLDFKKGISVLDVGCGSGAWILVRHKTSRVHPSELMFHP